MAPPIDVLPPAPAIPSSSSPSSAARRLARLKRKILGHPSISPCFSAHYTLGPVLGEGATAVVHAATRIKDGKHFACKVVIKDRLLTERDVRGVQDEIRILKEVAGCENIVKFVEAFEDEKSVALVMEWCEGGELFDHIVRKGKLQEKEAASLIRMALRALNHCHQRGIVHRDIKPENLLFTSKANETSLKLVDFGMAAQIRPGEVLTDRMGTPYYLAPEVILQKYDEKADIFSLGCILYILLSGRAPFFGETDAEILAMILKGKCDFKSEPWTMVSHEAKGVVRMMLKKDPSKRASAEELLEHPWIAQAERDLTRG